jgi:membrane carboxypeptidase/penicillin-binding protein PbpC
MIGYTPLYTIGIWCGNIDNKELTDTISKNFPKQLFLHIINYLMEENKNIWYEKPNDVYSLFTDPTGFNTGYEKNVYFIN